MRPLERPQAPVSALVFWASLAAAATYTAVYIWLIVANVPANRFGWRGRVLAVGLLLISVAATLAVTEAIAWTSRSWRDWRWPKVLGTFLALIVGTAGVASSVSTVFAPTGPTEASLKAVREYIKKVDRRLAEAGVGQGSQSAIERAIPVFRVNPIAQ
jgi:MFS family permease